METMVCRCKKIKIQVKLNLIRQKNKGTRELSFKNAFTLYIFSDNPPSGDAKEKKPNRFKTKLYTYVYHFLRKRIYVGML